MKASVDFWQRYQRWIAQGCLTRSKHPECFPGGVYPHLIKESKGCYAFDHDGYRYTDYITGLGTNLLGASSPYIVQAIKAAIDGGFSHSLGTHHEVLAAEQLATLFPFVRTWKFLKTGTEACMAAVRWARAVTGRTPIVSVGYHGHGDEFLSLYGDAVGVPEFAAAAGPPACHIVEPDLVPDLQALRDKCDKEGSLLIFDEIITGFRYRNFSMTKNTGVTPDAILLGKAMAGGMPLAAIGYIKDGAMPARYFASSTYAGESLSLAACRAMCVLLKTHTFYSSEILWEQGGEFVRKFNAIQPSLVHIHGYNTRGVFKAKDPETLALFFQEAALAGILFGPSWFFSYPLAQETDNTLHTCRDILNRIARGEVAVKYTHLPISPFAKKVRDKN